MSGALQLLGEAAVKVQADPIRLHKGNITTIAAKAFDSPRSYLQVHHGAVLGLAEVILALHTLNQQQQQQQQLTEDQISSIAELPSKLHAAMYLKGKGGEVMKAAISRLALQLLMIHQTQLSSCTSLAGHAARSWMQAAI